jgi:hypothetical protein
MKSAGNLTIHDTGPFIGEPFDAGANSYCIKDASLKELLSIDAVRNDASNISVDIVQGYLLGRIVPQESS